MTDPFNVAVNIVKYIVVRAKEVKTNREGCQLLAELAEQTLGILSQFKDNQFEAAISTALEYLNKALVEAQNAVDACSNSSFLSGMIHQQKFSDLLKNASTGLEHTLSLIPIATIGMNIDTKSRLEELSLEIRNAKFEDSGAMTDEVIVLQDQFKQLFFQSSKGNAEMKDLIRTLVQQQFSNKEELKHEIELLKKQISEASYNKERQLEFELSETASVVSESLGEHEGSSSTLSDPKMYEGWTSLHIAAKNNSVETIKELIAIGANINLQQKDGASPLHIASQNNSEEVVKLLIKEGANINIQQKDGKTPLHIASKKNLINIVEMLIVLDVKIDILDMNGESALFTAALNNSIDVAKMLITHGANINLQNNNRATSLHMASQYNSIDVAKELIAHGANIDLQDINGRTPLHIASQMNSINIAKELIANGAKTYLKNIYGWTSLHFGSAYGQLAIVKILLEHGASKYTRDNSWRTPIGVVCYLLSRGSYNPSLEEELKSLLKLEWFSFRSRQPPNA